MAYLGVTPTQEFSSVAKQSVTGDGSVSYTLNKGVSDANDLAVFVNDVRQEPGVAYTASGNTITFTANLESTDDCYILHIGRTFSSAESPGIEDKATQKVLTITTDGHLVPTANVTYDLGTSDLRFRDIYLSGSSIELGSHSITSNATHVAIGGLAFSNTISGDGSDLTTLNASELASGTIPDARFPATLPSANGTNLTSLNADELSSGTVPDARFPATLPSANGTNLTSLNATEITTGTIDNARLPSNINVANDLTIAGDLFVNGNTTTIAANELKVEDSLIQLASNNETSDTVDIGFVGHYYDGSTQVHTGFFRDASDEQYYLFKGYEDADFDTDTPPATIDRTANTFALAELNVGEFHSNYNNGDGISAFSGTVTITRQTGFPNIFWDDGTDNLGAIYFDKTNGMRIFSTDGSTGNPERFRINTSGQLIIQGNSDTSMSAAANGQFQVGGNGYTGAITLDGTAMYLYHNSASRALVLATNESAQLTLLASGDVQVNRGKIYVHDSAGSTANSLKLSYNATNGGAVIGPDSNGGSTYLSIGTSNSGTFAERMYISSTGNVGIGTSSPAYQLSVAEINSTASNRTTPVDVLEIQAQYQGGDGQPFGSAGGASFGSGLVFTNEKYTNSNITQSAAIYGLVSENSTATTGGGQLAFYTASTLDATLTEKMRILPNGNVGINEINPQEKLSVVGGILAASSSGSTSGITIESTATSGYVSTITHTDTGMEFDTGSILRHFKFDGAGTNLWTLYTNTGNIEQNYGVYRFAATTSGSDTGSQFQLWGSNGGPGYMAAYQLNFNTGNNNARTTAMTIDHNGKVTIANRLDFADIMIGTGAGKYIQVTGGSSTAWTVSGSGGAAVPGTASTSFGLHHWNASSWSEKLTVTTDGYVGIGTSNPSSMLHLYGTDPILKFQDSAGGDTFGAYVSNIDGFGIYNFTDSRQDLTIDSSGNVGIGTTATTGWGTGKAVTLGTSSSGYSLILRSAENGNSGLLQFIDLNGANAFQIGGSSNKVFLYGYGSRPIDFFTNGTERMQITSDGHLLVGGSGLSSSTSSNVGSITAGSTFGTTIAGNGGGGGTVGSNLTLNSSNAPRIAYTHTTGYGASGVYFSWGSTYFYNTAGNVTAGGAPDLSMSIGIGAGNYTVPNDMKHYDRSGNVIKRDRFYRFSTFSGAASAHMKTNISWASHTQMYSIHFEGQEYQASRAIDTTLSWYSYSPGNAAINIGSYGTHSATVYSSSDGYLVMRLDYNSTAYYSAFTLSMRTTAQGINGSFQVTAATPGTTANQY